MKMIRAFLVGSLIFGFAGVAQALPITDVYTPEGSPITLTTNNPYSYTHDLLEWGFDPVEDLLTDVTLSLVISGAGGQPLVITFDGIEEFDASLNTLLDDQPLEVALAYLQSDGLLEVTLTKGGGLGSTFTFTSSTLTAEGIVGGNSNGDPVQVPEPFVLALLGAGLLGLGIFSRRRVSSTVSAPQFA